MALAISTSSEAEEEGRALKAVSRGEFSKHQDEGKDTCLLEAQGQRGMGKRTKGCRADGNTLDPWWVLRSTMEILGCEEKR